MRDFVGWSVVPPSLLLSFSLLLLPFLGIVRRISFGVAAAAVVGIAEQLSAPQVPRCLGGSFVPRGSSAPGMRRFVAPSSSLLAISLALIHRFG